MDALRKLPSFRPSLYAGVALVALTAGWRWRQNDQSDGPQTLAEVAALAEHRGLTWHGDMRDGPAVARVVVATGPRSWEQVATLRLGEPDHPDWAGTVVVYAGWRSMLPNYVPGRSLVWGRMFVFGDPAVIRRLTGRAVDDGPNSDRGSPVVTGPRENF